MIDARHRSASLIYPTRAGWTALALAFVVSFSAVAQGPTGPGFGNEIPPPVYTTFSVDDGLASNDVAAMIQDRNGYIWFGTQRGVSRFDGYRFESIFPSPFEGESGMSLGSGWTHDLLESADGSIWIATGTGVSRYRHDSGRVEDFKGVPDAAPYASSLAEGPDGSIWIGAGAMWWIGQNRGADGSGLYRLDPSTGTFSSYRFGKEPARGLISDGVMDVAVDGSGHVWIASTSMHSLESGDPSALPPRADWTRAHEFSYFGRRFAAVSSLSRLDVETGLFTHFLSGSGGSETGATDSEELLFTLHIDHSGVLWFGTLSGYGWLDTNDANARPEFRRLGHAVWSIIEGPDGTVWFSTGTGIHRFDPASKELVRYPTPDELGISLSQPVLQDRSGNIWLARTNSSGVVKFLPDAARVATTRFSDLLPRLPENTAAFSFAEENPDRLWMGTGGGLLLLDRSSGRTALYRHDPSNPSSLSHDEIWDLLIDSAGRLWIVTPAALNRMDLDRPGVFVRPGTGSPDIPLDRAVRSVSETSGGVFWFGMDADQGLVRYDPAEGNATWYRHNPSDPRSIAGGTVSQVLEDEQGEIWIVGWGIGLHRWDPATDDFARFGHDPKNEGSLLSLFVSSIVQVPEDPGHLWLGAQEGGLMRFNVQTGRAEHFMRANGRFPDDAVWALTYDGREALWARTGRGLVRFDPSTFQYSVFDARQGLQDYWAHSRGQYLTSNGQLLLSQRGGFASVRPFDMGGNPVPPEVHVIDVRVDGQSVNPEPRAFSRALEGTGTLDLRHDQNNLTFQYVGLHFGDPAANHYRVMLENHETEWRDVGTLREVTYANLSPGAYTFRVSASNSDGVWSEEGVSLPIVIHPPWWRTIWAYLIYGIAFVAGVFGVDRVQRRRVIEREREQARLRELEQAREIERAYLELKETKDRMVQQEKLASLGQLTAGIAHEIKNPLNFINNFADINTELAAELREAYEANPEITLGALLDVVDDLKQNAGVIAQHGRRADAIVRSMMQHASGASGSREAVDLNALVGEYVDLAYHGRRAVDSSFAVQIERDLAPDVGSVSVVAQDMGRVILNLVGNAFDALSEHARAVDSPWTPRVRVSTRRVGSNVEIRVVDNGPGIPEAVRERIFEPFFTTKPAGSGTGLGLSLSFEIVTQGHGGTFALQQDDEPAFRGDFAASAESGHRSGGATFVITLPA